MADEMRVIVGTAVTVGGAIAAALAFAVRAIIAKDVTPTMVKLGMEANALTREFQTFREEKAEDRRETHAMLKALEKLVADHETTLALHDQRILRLEGPPPAAAKRRRAA